MISVKGVIRANMGEYFTRRRQLFLLLGIAILSTGVLGTVKLQREGVKDGHYSVNEAAHSILTSSFSFLLIGVLFGCFVAVGDAGTSLGNQLRMHGPVASWRLGVGRLLSSLLIGAFTGVLGVTIGISCVCTGLHDYKEFGWTSSLTSTAISIFAVITLCGAWGYAIGAVIGRFYVSVGLAVAVTVIIEPAIQGLLPNVDRWLPGGAQAAIIADQTYPERLPRAAGFAVLVGYIAIAIAGSLLRSERANDRSSRQRSRGSHAASRP